MKLVTVYVQNATLRWLAEDVEEITTEVIHRQWKLHGAIAAVDVTKMSDKSRRFAPGLGPNGEVLLSLGDRDTLVISEGWTEGE